VRSFQVHLDPSDVFAKTPDGVSLARTEREALTGQERQLLILIDGHRTVGELSAMFGGIALDPLLTRLMAHGLALQVPPAIPDVDTFHPPPVTEAGPATRIGTTKPASNTVAATLLRAATILRPPTKPGTNTRPNPAQVHAPATTVPRLPLIPIVVGLCGAIAAIWFTVQMFSSPEVERPSAQGVIVTAEPAMPVPASAAPARPEIAPAPGAGARGAERPPPGTREAPKDAPDAARKGGERALEVPAAAKPAAASDAASPAAPVAAPESTTPERNATPRAAAPSTPQPAPPLRADAPPAASAATAPAAGAVAAAPAPDAAQAVSSEAGAQSAPALKVIERVKPELPLRARRRSIVDGTVRVALHVAADGSVESVELLSATPPIVYDEGVRKTLSQWKFAPPGRPARAQVEIVFKP
jgi:TonB family protein